MIDFVLTELLISALAMVAGVILAPITDVLCIVGTIGLLAGITALLVTELIDLIHRGLEWTTKLI